MSSLVINYGTRDTTRDTKIIMYAMLYMIWSHLYNLKNMKNTPEGVLLLVKLQSSAGNFTKSNTLPWVFFTFFKIVQMVPNRAKRFV